MKSKRMSPAAINALKEALCSIYWYKNELRSFLTNCLNDRHLVASLDWNNYKRQIVSDLVDILCSDQDKYLSALTRLCFETISINNFSHLELIDGGKQKAERARNAVKQLKELVEPHQELKKEKEQLEARKRDYSDKLKSNKAVRKKLAELNASFLGIATGGNAQKKGYELEKLMYDIFELFDLDPKASFRIIGEQLDGSFYLEGTEYLFEAKWHALLISANDLDSFSMKVSRKLDNTLGVFLSMNGFSEDGIRAHSIGRPNIILMDGSDLMAVLEERIDLVSLLIRKKRHAAQTGEIYLPVYKLGL
ncbi:hypothetical protein [Desulfobacula sp.]|uniref:hypothetical protein n=1 Tax=Desulfobacula sp. TaxID=2593537 RepID=UPI002608A334|nr:hypothetical protein [Desulfobacula sp.]